MGRVAASCPQASAIHGLQTLCFLPWKVITRKSPYSVLFPSMKPKIRLSQIGFPRGRPQDQNSSAEKGTKVWWGSQEIRWDMKRKHVGNGSLILPGAPGPVGTMCPSVSSHLRVETGMALPHQLSLTAVGCSPGGCTFPALQKP